MIMNFPPSLCDECKQIKEFVDTVRCNYCNSVVCSECVVEHEYREAESGYTLCKGSDNEDHRQYIEYIDTDELDDSWIAYNPTPSDNIH